MRNRGGEIAEAMANLMAAGWKVEMATASAPEEVERLARMAVERGDDAVVVAGGDGTLSATVQALAHQPTALGVLPIGTTNVWAREMGIPLNVAAATRVLLTGKLARIDLGQANHRYFLFIASAGFDASVTRGVDPRAKRHLGALAYILSAVSEGLRLRGEETTIVADGSVSRQRVLMVAANNIRLYGGVVMMSPEAYADDGLLDVWVFRGRGLFAAMFHVVNVLLGRHPKDLGTDYHRCAKVVIQSRRPLPVQLDGDYFDVTPMAFHAVPGALRVIIPQGPHPQLRQSTTDES